MPKMKPSQFAVCGAFLAFSVCVFVASCGGSERGGLTLRDVVDGRITEEPQIQSPDLEASEESIGDIECRRETSGGRQLECYTQQILVERQISDVFTLASETGSLLPGMVLSGDAYVRRNVVDPIPVPRSPATLAIDLPVENPTRSVIDPSRATLAAAVAELIAEAGNQPHVELAPVAAQQADGGTPEVAVASSFVPARLGVSVVQSESLDEAALRLGISGSFSMPLVEAGLSLGFNRDASSSQRTVLVRIFQPMFTITMADDLIAHNSGFFRQGTDCDLIDDRGSCVGGLASPDDPPVFVSSITYGRVVVFSVTAESNSTSREFQASTHAKVTAAIASVQQDASARVEWSRFVSGAQIRVLALGGDQGTAFRAVQTGDFRSFFGREQSALHAVPLMVRARYLSPGRPTALMHLRTVATRQRCRRTNCGEAPPVETEVFGETRRFVAGNFWTGHSANYIVGPSECPSGQSRHRFSVRRVDGDGHCSGARWLSDNANNCQIWFHVGMGGRLRQHAMHCRVEIYTAVDGEHEDPLCRVTESLPDECTEEAFAATAGATGPEGSETGESTPGQPSASATE